MPLNKIYWLDEYKGECHGGYFTRCNLFEQIKMFEEKGFKVVGIKIEDGWNIEFICEEPPKKLDGEGNKQ
jgi:hypothetical protein